MERLKKLDRDKAYKIDLRLIEGCMEYCLVNINDSDDVYLVFTEEEIK